MLLALSQMSKIELKKYLKELSKEQLEEQLLDLYGRFKPVKVYYNFVFNPKEDKLLEESKFKISKEYFPTSGRRPKARRSVAQKQIKHYLQLGVEPSITADLMLYNIEVAQTYCADKTIKQASFYASMLKSFREAVKHVEQHGLLQEFGPRIGRIVETAKTQDWINAWAFEQEVTTVR